MVLCLLLLVLSQKEQKADLLTEKPQERFVVPRSWPQTKKNHCYSAARKGNLFWPDHVMVTSFKESATCGPV